MLFEKRASLNLLSCPVCQSVGLVKLGKPCRECRGLAIGHHVRGRWLYWAHPLARYYLSLAKGRRIWNKVRFLTALIIALNFWVWCGFLLYRSGIVELFFEEQADIFLIYRSLSERVLLFFWLGALCFIYVWYRGMRERESKGAVEHYEYAHAGAQKEKSGLSEYSSWRDILRNIPRRRRYNIAKAFTEEALGTLGHAYRSADRGGQREVALTHLFHALLAANRIGNIFIRLGLLARSLGDRVEQLIETEDRRSDMREAPLVSADFQQAIFQAYEEAYAAHQDYVSVTELLLAVVKQSPLIQELLYDAGIEQRKLVNAVEWARIRERLRRQYVKLRVAAGHRSKRGMDKAMTALATPYLNQFSTDMTLLAQFGHLDVCVARDKEMEEIFRVVEAGQQNVLLVGEYGVGKRTIIEGIAQKMVEEDVPERLKDKRLVRLSVAELLAGTTPAGAVERLNSIMYEIARARNVILFIQNIHELVGVTAGGESSLDVAGTLAERLRGGNFLTMATTTIDNYSKYIANSPLDDAFTEVEIKEMAEDQAIQALESKVGLAEYKNKVFFSYDALEKAVRFAARFMHEARLPGSALELMTEAASLTHNRKGPNALVTAEEVGAVVSSKTGIPATTVTSDESSKLLRLEEEMHKRVIGQDEAVKLVANALRRARAGVRTTSKPIANFLFLGPTGVGKTELAKTIAAVYFGGEERMARFDMSEYQDKSSIYRLIGMAGEKGTGLLTEAVRRHPFALLLLDEIEKADKDVINLFLQVMDDGRLTDSTGRVVDFTNIILIATSNAGTAYAQEQLRAGLSMGDIKEKFLRGELQKYFRPELLNRFDGIVLFQSLSREDLKKIAGLMLKRIVGDLEAKGIELRIEDKALAFLAEAGFDPEFGARPMRRVIQERIENQLAELLLSGRLKRGDKMLLGEGGRIEALSLS